MKTSKLALVSFGLAIILCLILLLGVISESFDFITPTRGTIVGELLRPIILFALSIATVVSGIGALIVISRYPTMTGKLLSVFGIVVGCLFAFPMVTYFLLISHNFGW